MLELALNFRLDHRQHLLGAPLALLHQTVHLNLNIVGSNVSDEALDELLRLGLGEFCQCKTGVQKSSQNRVFIHSAKRIGPFVRFLP